MVNNNTHKNFLPKFRQISRMTRGPSNSQNSGKRRKIPIPELLSDHCWHSCCKLGQLDLRWDSCWLGETCYEATVDPTLIANRKPGKFVGCLLANGYLMSQQHVSVSAPTILFAATLRQKLQMKHSISPSHSIYWHWAKAPALTL